MLEFPGEDVFILKKNGIPIKQEPLPKIGQIATCRVHKILPSHAHLYITHLDSKKTSIEYRGILRLQDYRACIDNNTFLDDFYKRGDVFDAMIISFGDSYGCYLSTISEEHGIVKNVNN